MISNSPFTIKFSFHLHRNHPKIIITSKLTCIGSRRLADYSSLPGNS